VADHNVQSLTTVEIVMVARDDVLRLMAERPMLAHAIMTDTMIDASIFREWILNIGRRDARARTAHLLCEFAMRLSVMGLTEDYACELPMTQEQLGDALGLTPVHVNRTLKVLTEQGLIERNRRRIAFPDWQKLKEAAGFNERYLHLEQRATRR
jgi:CRP-like cAMP-binding protein